MTQRQIDKRTEGQKDKRIKLQIYRKSRGHRFQRTTKNKWSKGQKGQMEKRKKRAKGQKDNRTK